MYENLYTVSQLVFAQVQLTLKNENEPDESTIRIRAWVAALVVRECDQKTVCCGLGEVRYISTSGSLPNDTGNGGTIFIASSWYHLCHLQGFG